MPLRHSEDAYQRLIAAMDSNDRCNHHRDFDEQDFLNIFYHGSAQYSSMHGSTGWRVKPGVPAISIAIDGLGCAAGGCSVEEAWAGFASCVSVAAALNTRRRQLGAMAGTLKLEGAGMCSILSRWSRAIEVGACCRVFPAVCSCEPDDFRFGGAYARELASFSRVTGLGSGQWDSSGGYSR
jgi:hypothetical protein